MVLHNNKWDRKAKYKYLKKHGLLKKQQQQQQQQQEQDEGSKDEQRQKVTDDLVDEDESDHSNISGTEEAEQLEESLVQDDLLAESSSEDDEEFLQYSEMTKNIKHFYDLNKEKQVRKKKIDPDLLENVTFEDLKSLDLGSSDEEDKVKSRRKDKTPKVLSAAEIKEFEKLQKKIEKDKILRSMRKKFGSKKSKQSIDDELESKANDRTFQDNLDELVGRLGQDKEPLDHEINIDELLESGIPRNGVINEEVSTPAKTERKTVLNKKLVKEDDEKLLDDLLGL